jgi:hypothetical protein
MKKMKSLDNSLCLHCKNQQELIASLIVKVNKLTEENIFLKQVLDHILLKQQDPLVPHNPILTPNMSPTTSTPVAIGESSAFSPCSSSFHTPITNSVTSPLDTLNQRHKTQAFSQEGINTCVLNENSVNRNNTGFIDADTTAATITGTVANDTISNNNSNDTSSMIPWFQQKPNSSTVGRPRKRRSSPETINRSIQFVQHNTQEIQEWIDNYHKSKSRKKRRYGTSNNI